MHRTWHLSPYSVFEINEHYSLDVGEYTRIFIVGTGRNMIVFYNLQMNLTINKNIVLGLIWFVLCTLVRSIYKKKCTGLEKELLEGGYYHGNLSSGHSMK